MKVFLLLLLLLFNLYVVTLWGQSVKIDSLKKVIETTKVDTVKGRSMGRLCMALAKAGDYETGIKKASEGIKILERVKDGVGIAHCNKCMAEIYSQNDNHTYALDCYQRSLKIFERIGDKKYIAHCLSQIGTAYNHQGNFNQALNYHLKSLKISEQLSDKKEMARSYNNLGTIYYANKNQTKALDYYQKALNIFEQANELEAIAPVLLNMGSIYFTDNKYPKALKYYHKGLKIFEQLNNQPEAGITLSLIGNTYYEMGDKLKALDFHKKSLKIAEASNKLDQISFISCGLAHSYIETSRPVLGKVYAQKALRTAQEINYLTGMYDAAQVSYQADSALGDYKSAFEHHKLYKQYSDSLHNEDKAKEFGRVESKYQFEKEAEEQKRKEAELTKIEAEKTKRRNNLQYLTIFAGIIGLFAGLVFIGKFRIPTRVTDVAVFAGLLILFEFLLILFDPWLDNFSGGIPFYKLGFNTVVAFAFAPLHGFLEDKLKKRLVKAS